MLQPSPDLDFVFFLLAPIGIPLSEASRALNFLDYSGHGGESVRMLRTRIARALSQTPPDALVVTHAGCIKAALAVRNVPDAWDARPAFGACVPLPD